MAPVEVDYVPASIVPAKNLKVVNKAMELPLVNSAYSEVTRIASPITPYVETTLTKVSPMLEAGYQTIKTQVEEKLVPHIPSNLSDSVSKNMSSTLESVSAAVEKADSYACSGIDQLTEKVPQLKDATPKLLEETKENVSSYITAATDYTASFSLAQLALKVVDAGLTAVEGILSKVGQGEECLVVSGVRKVHSTANTIRLSGLEKAGTEKAKKIEEGTILEAVLFLFAIPELMESLGFKLGKPEKETETVYEDEVSRVEVKHEEEKVEEPVVVDTAEKVEEAVVVDTADKVEEAVVVDTSDKVEEPVVVDTSDKMEEPVVVDTSDEVEEAVVVDTSDKVEEPVVVDDPLDIEKVDEPVMVETADTEEVEEVEEAVEVATAYSRTLRTRKVENVMEDSE